MRAKLDQVKAACREIRRDCDEWAAEHPLRIVPNDTNLFLDALRLQLARIVINLVQGAFDQFCQLFYLRPKGHSSCCSSVRCLPCPSWSASRQSVNQL